LGRRRRKLRWNEPPHPVLEASLHALRIFHKDSRGRRILQEIARLYHEGFPGAPQEKVIRLAREKREREPSAPTGRRVAPHVRRAHWHLYWVGEGSRKDPSRAKPVLRWVPATLVNRDLLEKAGLGPEDLPAVVRRVLKEVNG
jgi:hypothetical protein